MSRQIIVDNAVGCVVGVVELGNLWSLFNKLLQVVRVKVKSHEEQLLFVTFQHHLLKVIQKETNGVI